jgi:hypothetical protein
MSESTVFLRVGKQVYQYRLTGEGNQRVLICEDHPQESVAAEKENQRFGTTLHKRRGNGIRAREILDR